MRRLTYILLVAMTLLGCSQHKIIPDRELVQIFRDAFLTNAYITVKNPDLDSLNIYEPIFESYGYTTEDVQYTIGNFSKRKSARLGDIVEGAIRILEIEGISYGLEVTILDTVSAISRRREMEVLLSVDEILIESQNDTLNLMLSVEGIKSGDYVVRFDYLIDSLDKNTGSYRTLLWFNKKGIENIPKEDRGRLPHYQEKITYLQRGKVQTVSNKIEVKQDYHSLDLQLVDFMGKKGAPHIKIRDLRVEYTPIAEDAERMLFDRMVNLKIFSDELFTPTPQDSI